MTAASSSLKPEERVRQRIITELRHLGWSEDCLQWRPEWAVPDTPHDLTKRDRGQRFAICGTCDLVAFADESREPHALQVIFEFKAPDIDAGRTQLMRYLSNELGVAVVRLDEPGKTTTVGSANFGSDAKSDGANIRTYSTVSCRELWWLTNAFPELQGRTSAKASPSSSSRTAHERL